MVTIRLARGGAKARPFFHVVVANSRDKRDGNHIERLGFFNPIAVGQDVEFQLDEGRYAYWVSVGAQATPRVKKLVKQFRSAASQTATAA
ncbi:MAG: 30S ribosomal protein S16 [Proteobacteria bacterium]|nr:30S ribosomal protein S16 [Pseudomonadota bacterium]